MEIPEKLQRNIPGLNLPQPAGTIVALVVIVIMSAWFVIFWWWLPYTNSGRRLTAHWARAKPSERARIVLLFFLIIIAPPIVIATSESIMLSYGLLVGLVALWWVFGLVIVMLNIKKYLAERKRKKQVLRRKPFYNKIIREAFARQHELNDKYRERYVTKNLSQILEHKDKTMKEHIEPKDEIAKAIKDVPTCRQTASDAIKLLGREITHHKSKRELAELLLAYFEEPHKRLQLAQKLALDPKFQAKVEEEAEYQFYLFRDDKEWRENLRRVVSKAERLKKLAELFEQRERKIEEGPYSKDAKKKLLADYRNLHQKERKRVMNE